MIIIKTDKIVKNIKIKMLKLKGIPVEAGGKSLKRINHLKGTKGDTNLILTQMIVLQVVIVIAAEVVAPVVIVLLNC